MKILIIQTTAGYIDLEKNNSYNHQEIGLAKAFNRLGHTCDVVYYGGRIRKIVKLPYNQKGDEFQIFYLKAINFFKDSIFQGLHKLTKDYDIIHAGGYDTVQSWLLAKKYPEKLVIFNGTYYNSFNKGYNKKCKIIDKLFVPTYIKNNIQFDTKNRLSETFLREKSIKNIDTVGVGIDLSIIDAVEGINSEFANSLSILKKSGVSLLLYVGRIEPRRNIKFLFDIVKAVSEKKNVRLVMIGKGKKKYMNECFSYAKEQGIMPNIIYKEFMDQKHLKSIYKLCNIFLLTTIYDIFGMVLLESMYYGMPVISTLNGGSDLLIKDKENGFIVSNNNLKQWKETVLYILSHPEEAKKIGVQASETIKKGYTWDTLAIKFLKIFQQLLNKHE